MQDYITISKAAQIQGGEVYDGIACVYLPSKQAYLITWRDQSLRLISSRKMVRIEAFEYITGLLNFSE